jgi:hypothetical protein
VTNARRGFSFLPPFLAGLAGAVALETSAGLLLYNDDGLLPALTLVLVVEIGALGLGLWSAPLPVGGGAVEQIRRRWLLCLVAFAMASAVAAGLNFRSDITGTGLAQGTGLGFLGALPLFSVGTLLGAMTRPDDLGRVHGTPVGPAAVLGAGTGFFLAGVVLIPELAPHTLYLFCLVILSGGALLQGWVLDGRVAVEVVARANGRNGELRMERRVLGTSRRELLVLKEGERTRGAENPAGRPGRGWEAAVLELLALDGVQPESVLYLGGGSGTLGRFLAQRFPHSAVQLVEMDGGLVELARTHFRDWDGWEAVSLAPGGLINWGGGDRASVVLVDGEALPALGGVPSLTEGEWRGAAEKVEEGGLLVMGGIETFDANLDLGDFRALADLTTEAEKWFHSVALYRRSAPGDESRLLWGRLSGPEFFLILSKPGAPSVPRDLSGFRLVEKEGA